MYKILVVDDETDLQILIRQKFRKKIKQEEYAFFFAENGFEALEKMQEQPAIDLVLSDINMPGMDGLTLLGKINELAPLTKTVMVSAYGDMDNIRLAMNRGAYDFVVKPINFKDLERTMEKTLQQVEQMKTTVKSIKENNILKMYVDETVLNFMGSRDFETALTANELIEATVVFIDICHFTAYSEKEPPNTVVKMLNRYFEIMVKEILEQDGQIDKFMGDSVMALFKGPDHLTKAIQASLAIKQQIKAQATSAAFEVSIGINCGEMISGNIGSASLKRLDYTVIGDVVNTAQRLQDAAQPNQILTTQAVAKQIDTQFNCLVVGEKDFKNKTNPIVVFEILNLIQLEKNL